MAAGLTQVRANDGNAARREARGICSIAHGSNRERRIAAAVHICAEPHTIPFGQAPVDSGCSPPSRKGLGQEDWSAIHFVGSPYNRRLQD